MRRSIIVLVAFGVTLTLLSTRAPAGGQTCEVPQDCDDSNPCTTEFCTSFTCSNVPNADPCDDGLFCNGSDTCSEGSCSAHSGDPCAGGGECADACNEAADSCPDTLGTPCTADENPCTDDFCDGTGVCTHPAASAGECDDALFCNGTEFCSGVECVSTGDPCTARGECADSCNEELQNCAGDAGSPCTDDGNECTDDLCDLSEVCTHPANTAPCNDGVFCNGNDTCVDAVCGAHSGDPCEGSGDCTNTCNEEIDVCLDELGTPCTDDGNPCTDDSCDATGVCTHPANTAPCDDGLFCNGADTCTGGGCDQHGGDPCEGGPVCADTCNEETGCLNPAGSPCTNDENDCTDDQCDGTGVCTHTANTASCDDEVFCNGADFCLSGVCTGHAGDPCSGPDGDANCSESCDELTRACTAPDQNESECDDGSFCNGDDFCLSGVCTGHVGNPCAETECNTCQEEIDSCLDPPGTACTDNGLFCDGSESCNGDGGCVGSGDSCPGSDCNSCQEATDSCFDPAGTACAPGDGPCAENGQCNGSGMCLPSDADGDGVCDSIENGAPNGGDGNGDGILDSIQSDVASLPSATGSGYLTVIVSNGCTQLEGLGVFTEESIGEDRNFSYPFGLLGFDLECETAKMTVLYHGGRTARGAVYRKYGPLIPGGSPFVFYTLPAMFSSTVVGGVTVSQVMFNLADNSRGDDTGDDGHIVDQGGPGIQAAPAPALSVVGTLLAFASLLAVAWLAIARLREASPATKRR